MQFSIAIVSLAVAAFSQGALAVPKAHCASTKTVTATPTGVFACPNCPVATTTCTSGQASTRPPATITNGCTVTVENECPCTTCLPSATKTSCSTTATVTTAQKFVCDIFCATPTTSTCKKGEPTGPPATNTVTAGCTVSLIRLGCPGCASCVAPTATPL